MTDKELAELSALAPHLEPELIRDAVAMADQVGDAVRSAHRLRTSALSQLQTFRDQLPTRQERKRFDEFTRRLARRMK